MELPSESLAASASSPRIVNCPEARGLVSHKSGVVHFAQSKRENLLLVTRNKIYEYVMNISPTQNPN